jgi:PilZ domain-containing protein
VLRDLSEHGALVEMSEAIEPDSVIFFRRNGLSVRGHIAWVRGNKAGVAFARPLKAKEVLRYIARPDERAPDRPVFRRPAVTQKGMSAEERRWADEMMIEPSRRNRRK